MEPGINYWLIVSIAVLASKILRCSDISNDAGPAFDRGTVIKNMKSLLGNPFFPAELLDGFAVGGRVEIRDPLLKGREVAIRPFH